MWSLLGRFFTWLLPPPEHFAKPKVRERKWYTPLFTTTEQAYEEYNQERLDKHFDALYNVRHREVEKVLADIEDEYQRFLERKAESERQFQMQIAYDKERSKRRQQWNREAELRDSFLRHEFMKGETIEHSISH